MCGSGRRKLRPWRASACAKSSDPQSLKKQGRPFECSILYRCHSVTRLQVSFASVRSRTSIYVRGYPTMARHPFQCVVSVRLSPAHAETNGCIVAACGSKLLSVSNTDGAIVSEWKPTELVSGRRSEPTKAMY